MTWIKLDDNAPNHPKIAGLSDKAFRWWIRSLCYASEYLTDGKLPFYFTKQAPPRVVNELRDSKLWILQESGWTIHDYLVHQNSRDYVEKERAFHARRNAFSRNTSLRQQIQERDGSNCRYCGRDVSWTDRRGPSAATYDHVIPRGPEALDNLVVCCRECNSSKGPRTPEQAGMTLLKPRSKPSLSLGLSRQITKPENRDQIQTQRTDPERTPPASVTTRAPLALAGSLPRDHMDCGFCGTRFCLKSKTVRDLVARYGDGGEAAVPAWLKALNDGLGPSQSPGGPLWVIQQFDAHLLAIGRMAPAAAAPNAKPTPGGTHAERLAAAQRSGRA